MNILNNNTPTPVIIGAAHWEHEKESLEAMGYKLIQFLEYINGKPRWAELEPPKQKVA